VENLAKFPQKIAKLVKFKPEKKKKNPKISKIWLKKETLLRGYFDNNFFSIYYYIKKIGEF
jgi:hypothetical protein